jgi:hypothetical protein
MIQQQVRQILVGVLPYVLLRSEAPNYHKMTGRYLYVAETFELHSLIGIPWCIARLMGVYAKIMGFQ